MTNPEYGWKPDPDGSGFVRMKPDELPPPPRTGYWCVLTGLEKAPEKNGLIVELVTKDGKEPETQKQGEMDIVECKLGGMGGGTPSVARRRPACLPPSLRLFFHLPPPLVLVCVRARACVCPARISSVALAPLLLAHRNLHGPAEESGADYGHREDGFLPFGRQARDVQLEGDVLVVLPPLRFCCPVSCSRSRYQRRGHSVFAEDVQ